MQKNKFVYEDIKAVCSSATKKLVAMGLAVAVGGTCTIGGSCNRVVSAQTPPETSPGAQPAANEFQQRIDNLMRVRRERRIARRSYWPKARLDSQEEFERRQIAENPDRLNQLEEDEIEYWDASPTIFGQDAEIRHPNIDLNRNLERQLENEQARRRTAEGRAQMLERRQNQPHTQHTDATPQMIQARGNQHIEAGPNTHVHSFSDNELTHEGEGEGEAKITGPGSVDIGVGDVTVSECNEDLSRNVTVNQAHSLTVAPGIPTRIQNCTEFTIGHTAQETLENLQRAMGLPLGRERNAQRSQSTNCALNFIISVIVALWSFSLGSLFGGSGGSK